MSLRITNGRIIDPANDLDQKADLFIDDEGFIAGIGKAPEKFLSRAHYRCQQSRCLPRAG